MIVFLTTTCLAVFLFYIAYFTKHYRICPSNKALVIYGKGEEGKNLRCVVEGGALVLPFIQKCETLSLEVMDSDFELRNFCIKNSEAKVNFRANIVYCIPKNPRYIMKAAVKILSLTQDEIKRMAKNIIQGQIRNALSNLTLEEIKIDEKNFIENLKDAIDLETFKIGIGIEYINIKELEII